MGKNLLQTVKRQAQIHHFELKTINHEYTRKTAAILSTLALIKNDTVLSAEAIDNQCFDFFNFTLAHNKTAGKTKSNLLKRRLPKYLDNHLFTYDALSDLVVLTAQGTSVLLKQIRENVSIKMITHEAKKAYESITFKGRKSIVTKADSKRVSSMLLNHLN